MTGAILLPAEALGISGERCANKTFTQDFPIPLKDSLCLQPFGRNSYGKLRPLNLYVSFPGNYGELMG